MKKVSVSLKIEKGEILNELTRRSSYTALSAQPVENAPEEWSDKIVLSGDDYEWCEDKFRVLFFRLRDIFIPYGDGGEGFADYDNRKMVFKIVAPSEFESTILHYVKEMMVNYILAEWFIDRMPEKAVYLAQQYENVSSLLKITLNRDEKVRRPTTYL